MIPPGNNTVDVQINADVPIAARDFGGDGSPVVLVHGFGRTLIDWTAVAPLLTPRFRVVAYDLRGHGASGEGPWSWQAHLDDLELVVAGFGLDRPAVVGHSLGGMIAAAWGANHPECLAAINLDGHGMGSANLYEGVDPALVENWQEEMKSRTNEMIDGLTAPRPREAMDGLIEQRVAMDVAQGVPLALARASIVRSMRIEDGSVRLLPSAETFHACGALVATDLMRLWRSCACPLLLVNAVADPIPEAEPASTYVSAYRRGLARALDELATESDTISVTELDVDHGLTLKEPRLVADLVTTFLAARELPS